MHAKNQNFYNKAEWKVKSSHSGKQNIRKLVQYLFNYDCSSSPLRETWRENRSSFSIYNYTSKKPRKIFYSITHSIHFIKFSQSAAQKLLSFITRCVLEWNRHLRMFWSFAPNQIICSLHWQDKREWDRKTDSHVVYS